MTNRSAHAAVVHARERWHWDTPSSTYALICDVYATTNYRQKPRPKPKTLKRRTS